MQQIHSQDHMRIGRYQSWLEDGKLRLYYHRVWQLQWYVLLYESRRDPRPARTSCSPS